jgi:hypothetical protein
MRIAWSRLGLFAAAVALVACGGAQKKGDPNALPADASVEKTDVNGDSKPDIVKYYVGQASERKLARMETDLNGDGIPDKITYYDLQTGKVTRVEANLDTDKKVDLVDYYDADGMLARQEVSRNFDGKFDVVKTFKQGKLYSREMDSDVDGKIDLWEYYNKDGQLYRIGKDQDGDGKPEYFEDVKKK